MNTLAGKGISVAAPASGAFSMYTNWEQDGSRQWETFLSQELPDWLAANKGLAPNGHGIVGAAQGGYGAVTMATFYPDRYRFAASLSGFLTPSRTFDERRDHGRPDALRRRRHPQYVGSARSWAAGSGTTPTCTSRLLAENNTRLWIFSPQTLTCSDDAAMICYCDQAHGQQPLRSTSTTARSAATTATSTSRRAATTTGRRGPRSWAPWPASWWPLSNSSSTVSNCDVAHLESCRSAGTVETCNGWRRLLYRGDSGARRPC